MIPILCLFFFGGAVLRDFSLAIIIGVVGGNLFLDLYCLADRPLVDPRPRRRHEQPAPGSDAEEHGNRSFVGQLIWE